MQATVFTLAPDAPTPHASLIDVEVEDQVEDGAEVEVAADGAEVTDGAEDAEDARPADAAAPADLLGTVILDDGREADLPAAALAGSSLRHLRIGQRLSVDLDPDRPDERGQRRITRARIVGIGAGERIR